jgi:hypothetical protein
LLLGHRHRGPRFGVYSWWDRHHDFAPWYYLSVHRDRPYYWWRWGTWPVVSSWYWGSRLDPWYYDYGTTVVYRDNYVYVNDERYGTAEDYAASAWALAARADEALAERDATIELEGDAAVAMEEWQPLGMYGITHAQIDTEPRVFLQLALRKDGLLTGTYHNQDSNKTQPVKGFVDKDTQRAAWVIGENPNVVMEAGLYNLTEGELTALSHNREGQTNRWLMVRLQAPDETGSSSERSE